VLRLSVRAFGFRTLVELRINYRGSPAVDRASRRSAPDGHIGYGSGGTDVRGVERYLARWLPVPNRGAAGAVHSARRSRKPR
jgi:hypothetical protein